MVTNDPSGVFTDMELKYIESLNERQKRHCLAVKAKSLGRHGVTIVSRAIGADRKTIYRGIHELESDERFPKGFVRCEGGGRTCILDKHPKYIDTFNEIVDDEIAGLPQDEDIRWLKSSPSQIREKFEDDYHIPISNYVVKQILSREGYRHQRKKRRTHIFAIIKKMKFSENRGLRKICSKRILQPRRPIECI